MYRVEQVASTNAQLLLLGERGTGKELVARAIHNQEPPCPPQVHHGRQLQARCHPLSSRASCSAAIAAAFTGAHTSQPGRFELADGGTISPRRDRASSPFAIAAKTASCPAGKPVRMVLVAHAPVHVDVRIVAATNRNLVVEDVNSGKFRQDLFYRLTDVPPITLPALRERLEDLPALLRHFSDRVWRYTVGPSAA